MIGQFTVVIATAAFLAFSVHAASCMGDMCTDEELRHDVLEFLTTRYCGSFGRRVLTNEIRFDGDTNRLAGVLSEFALTNDEWIATRAVRQLGEYGTSAQLPFLYSCVTNPIIGDRAVKSILNIEGVTSNSVDALHDYLFQTNFFPFPKVEDRSNVCVDLVSLVYTNSSLIAYRSTVYNMALAFESNVNLVPNVLDAKLLSVAECYRYSRRRLAALRSAKARIDAELMSVEASGYEVWRRTYCYTFQTNYLDKAISELVAYPEANLPD